MADPYATHFGNSVADFDLRAASIRSKALESTQVELPGFENVLVLRPQANDYQYPDLKPVAKFDWMKARLKLRLKEPFEKLNKPCLSGQFTTLQSSLFPIFHSFTDLLFSYESHETTQEIRHVAALHAVNHVLKTRDRILSNNEKLASLKDLNHGVFSTQNRLVLEDQGYTRPKVLFLLPFKNAAFDLIKNLISLSGARQIENKSRFMSEFGPSKDDEPNPKKPADYQIDFRGNIDDCFRVGLKFSRKHLKLYSDFYASDILVASPLGLRMIIGADGDRDRDFDFLSSIEIVVLDHTDVFLMQNWEHVEHVFDHLNLIPRESHGCDFSRAKKWYLDGHAKHYRQTIVCSHYNSPEINSLWSRGLNVEGRVKITCSYPGSIAEVVVQLPQMFYKVPATSLQTADDERFKYFTEKMLPQLFRSNVELDHTLIFIPSYFDFVRLRNYMTEREHEFGQLSEYSTPTDIARARSLFFDGRLKIVLQTERFHFFRRMHIRGTHHLVLYGLPAPPRFYPELVNAVEKADVVSCVALFNRFDVMRLERVVGSARVRRLLEKETFLFA
ncbi:hypothetical protein DFJ73DRAFT_791073 [Zopfochytrium polystomum]|nr:hypothetical protein DFJ73DRAFT_791073 [Zopfochytrium polystomum]